MPTRRAITLALMAATGPWPALAAEGRVARYTARLTGDQNPANTGSKATGTAAIAVDVDAQTVDLDLAVVGITLDQLWDKLTAAPIGPIHFHHYGAMHHRDDASVTLVLPVPYGPAYADTADGFAVTMKGFSYAAGAALLKSDVSFDAFMASMDGGLVALNVHTDKFPDGEINGAVVKAPVVRGDG